MDKIIDKDKLIKLCELINGKMMIPPSYTFPRCVVDEKEMHTGKEEVSPYIFHKINHILEARRNLVRLNEQISDEQEELKDKLKPINEYIQRYKKEEEEESQRIMKDVEFGRYYGDEAQREKSEKILEIIK